ncbi:ATP-binding protein [Micromonospora pattaloongensis]|uniref:ATP-binding protein n=1 Tax=Micromonospora pattaloongensis TaxID=405436 RepID=UPI001FDECAE0|nr:ATP-binding protein [Micromonospora pattaloongensis]
MNERRVNERLPVTVARLSGVLDTSTTAAVRTRLQRCLADQPEALVIDLGGLTVRHPSTLAVFGALARQAAAWPAVPVLLCAPDHVTAQQLAGSPVRRLLPVRATLDAALRDARSAGAAPRLRARLQPVRDACRQARELATEACGRWKLPEVADAARVVVSELVANGVRHAGTPLEVTLSLRQPYLHVAVHDGSVAAPRTVAPDLTDTGGRGILLIRQLARFWGSLPAADGKVVWASLAA